MDSNYNSVICILQEIAVDTELFLANYMKTASCLLCQFVQVERRIKLK